MSEPLHAIPEIKGYLITKTGKVWSETKSRFLTGKIAYTGYKMVEYYVDGIRKRKNIHRILAELFIPNPENKPEVNHKDGDKLNCELSNLEWATHQENMSHANKTGLIKNRPKGTSTHFAKLNEQDVSEIKKSTLSARKLSLIYGIAHQNIRKVKTGETWYHVIA